MPSYSKLIQSIMRENYTDAKREFSSLVAKKMEDVAQREYKEVGETFAKEQAPPQQDSYVEEVSTDEPSSSSNMEQMDDPELGIRAREVVGEKGAQKV